jgi:hypothetical protein
MEQPYRQSQRRARSGALTRAFGALAVSVGVAAAGGAVYVVDQRHPQAADQNAGSAAAPLLTIARAAALVQPGDTVLIRTGIYREAVVVETAGTAEQPIHFIADEAAQVVVTGADVLGEWTPEEGATGVFSTPWPHAFIGWNANRAHPDDAGTRVIGRAEQVFVQGYPLHQVLRREELSRGSFWVDQEGQRLLLRTFQDADPKDLRVEASTRPQVWASKGAYIQVRGLRFRYAANAAQSGGTVFGAHSTVEDCVFERMNSVGAGFIGQDIVVRRCVFQDNGQLGFTAYQAHQLLFSECVVRNNNTKDFPRGWEAGGNKLCLCRGVVIERSQFLANRGTGVWFDIGNEDCTVRQCLIADNEDAGLFYEISYGLKAHDNVFVGNGFAGTPGSWGADGAITLSSSPGGVIERNLIVGNKEGIQFREQNRRTPRLPEPGAEEAVWNHDESIHHNLLAYNREAQLWGWFDVGDERHWPKALQEHTADDGKAAADLAAGYQAMDASGNPVGLALEHLKITIHDNLYVTQPGQGLLNWGTTWKRHRRYATLDEARRELGFEEGGRCETVRFGDVARRDFRVAADSPAMTMGCYPQGEVPGVRLGVLDGR